MSRICEENETLTSVKQDIKFFKRVISNLDLREIREKNGINDEINKIKSSSNNLRSLLEDLINKEILEAYKLILASYGQETHFEFCIGPDAVAEIAVSELYKSVEKILDPVIKIFDIEPDVCADRFPSSKIECNFVYKRSVYFVFDHDEYLQNITVTINVKERLLRRSIFNIKEIYKTTININN